MEKPIVVIGAGIGGLSAAVHLAAAGYRVMILEQNATVGGKMSRMRADGFTWDTGPSVITMAPVLRALFDVAGQRMEDHLTLVPVEPLTRYFYADGVVLDATRDHQAMIDQIARLNPRDVEGYLGFLAHVAALDRITRPLFIEGDPPTPWRILQVPIADMLRVDAWRTMDAAIRHWIRDPHLRMLLGRYATYVGASPFEAPAVLNVIAHTELTTGIWYIQGGVYSLAQAFRQLAETLGVDIRTQQRVTQIQVDDDGSVQGTITAEGDRIAAAAVVANVDVTTVYHDLLPLPRAHRRLKRLMAREPSLSGLVLLLGLRDQTPALAQHNILFSDDYRREFDELVHHRRLPTSPTLYVSISSRQDPGHAPEGGENWFVLVNVPPRTAAVDWRQAAAPYRNLILDRLARAGLGVRPRIVSEHTITPLDLETGTGAWRGSLYGMSSNHVLSALRRPHPRDPLFKGLYCAGGTTHPGGGVPMVTLSGAVAARMLITDRDARAGTH